DSSFALARQALSTARASGYSMGELGSQLTLAQLYEQQAVFSKAIEALLAALRIADAIGD
ncbi:MAG TPA: hypothetical protein DCP28_27910, partial [Cytophagales bacterium]|nr:hypothetical protein [Cytophagales bacterium]